MANIKLNNNEYPIPDSILAGPRADFVTHLGTIAGSGLKVVVGGVEYSVDSTKVTSAVSELEAVLADICEERLDGDGQEFYTMAPSTLSFRSTAPLSELQDVQINGVTVDPANYTLEEGSTIVKLKHNYLSTLDKGKYEVAIISDSKTVKGGFTVAAPELNEYGFYYNQPYYAIIELQQEILFGPELVGEFCFMLHPDNTASYIHRDVGYIDSASVSYENGMYAIEFFGTTFFGIFSADGKRFIGTETLLDGVESREGVEFVMSTEVLACDDEWYYLLNTYSERNWAVHPVNKLKSTYAPIKNSIKGLPVSEIGMSAFIDNNNIINIDIPNSITTIGNYAFKNCSELTEVSLPDSVTSIGSRAFLGCTGLTSIMIPNSVKSIGDAAFENCNSLTHIIISDSVTTINFETFRNCSSLVSIVIPNSVTKLDLAVFKGCASLTSIDYLGSTREWSAISKAHGTVNNENGDWNSGCSEITVTCTDGTVIVPAHNS